MLPMTKKLAQFIKQERKDYLAVVVAQLTARPLPIPEDSGSNPVIGKLLLSIFTVSCVCRRRK